MQITPSKYARFFIALGLFLFVFGGQPAEFGIEKSFFHGYIIRKPIIRIALGVNVGEIEVSSSSGMKIYEVKSNYKLIADDAGEAHVEGRKEKINEKFLIQVAQTENREKAEIVAQEIRSKIDNRVTVKHSAEEELTGSFQVNVGDFPNRQDALHYIKKLNQLGIKDPWILREEITEGDAEPLWIQVNGASRSLSSNTVLYFIPSHPRSYLTYNKRNYRGIFVLRASRRNLVLVNILNIEDYLKSVVPSELSPYTFPQIEALKTQAVASRTYALKNLGLNGELNFDLYDTPRSQFYKGMNAEHPLSSLAVKQTSGEVALYKGNLIDALYTSTCGGMTENVEEVFQGAALPYLRSTECEYEKNNGQILPSQNIVPAVSINGGSKQLEKISPISTREQTLQDHQITPKMMLQRLFPERKAGSKWKSEIEYYPQFSLYTWQVKVPREKLENRINRYYPVGELRDLKTLRRGESKRVVELLITGADGEVIVNGFRIRKILGLKETLFVISRECDNTGKVSQFIFRGRGLGHGVGLCQVGASGMARAGSRYNEILKKYYQGIKIRKIY